MSKGKAKATTDTAAAGASAAAPAAPAASAAKAKASADIAATPASPAVAGASAPGASTQLSADQFEALKSFLCETVRETVREELKGTITAEFVRPVMDGVAENMEARESKLVQYVQELTEIVCNLELTTETQQITGARREGSTVAASSSTVAVNAPTLFKQRYKADEETRKGCDKHSGSIKTWRDTAGKDGGKDWLAKNPSKDNTPEYYAKEAAHVWKLLTKEEQNEWKKRAKELKDAPPPKENMEE